MAHPFDAVVLEDHGTQHVLGAEPCRDPFENQRQSFADLRGFWQQREGLLVERLDIDREQFEIPDGGEQLDLGEVFGKQSRQVLDVARRLGGAEDRKSVV